MPAPPQPLSLRLKQIEDHKAERAKGELERTLSKYEFDRKFCQKNKPKQTFVEILSILEVDGKEFLEDNQCINVTDQPRREQGLVNYYTTNKPKILYSNGEWQTHEQLKRHLPCKTIIRKWQVTILHF
jgi:hypothetical protein